MKTKNDVCRIQEIPIEDLEQKTNCRGIYKDHEISELMNSIKQVGLLQPPGVRPGSSAGKYEVCYGNRRVVAAKKLGWKTIPCRVDEVTDTDLLIKNATENLQRKDPSYAEYGRIFSELESKGLTLKEIAARVGLREERVKAISKTFASVPEELRQKISLSDRSSKKNSISLATVSATLNSFKDFKTPAKIRKDVLNYALENKSSHQDIKDVTRMVAKGYSLKRATAELKETKRIAVHFLASKKQCDKFKARTGTVLSAAIHDFVIASGAFPLIGKKGQ